MSGIIFNRSGRQGKTVKQNNLRILGLAVLAGLIAGSLFANIYCNDNVSELGVFHLDFIEKMQSMNVQGGALFWYVLSERLKWWAVVGVLALTGLNHLVMIFYPLVFGFMTGTACSMLVMVYGMKGVFYFGYLCLIVQCIYFVSAVLEIFGGAVTKKVQGAAVRGIVFAVLSLVITGAGAAVETVLYMNFAQIFYQM